MLGLRKPYRRYEQEKQLHHSEELAARFSASMPELQPLLAQKSTTSHDSITDQAPLEAMCL